MTKDPLSARISTSTISDLEEFAEEKDISKSEATDRLLDEALRVKNDEAKIVITDGSGSPETKQRLDEAESRIVAEIDQKISEVNQKLPEAETEPDNSEMIINIIGLIYIAGIITLDVSPIVSILTGLILLLLVVYTQVGNWRDYLGDQR